MEITYKSTIWVIIDDNNNNTYFVHDKPYKI